MVVFMARLGSLRTQKIAPLLSLLLVLSACAQPPQAMAPQGELVGGDDDAALRANPTPVASSNSVALPTSNTQPIIIPQSQSSGGASGVDTSNSSHIIIPGAHSGEVSAAVSAPPEEVFEGPITLDHMPYASAFSYPMGDPLTLAGAVISFDVGKALGHLGDDYWNNSQIGDPVHAVGDGVVYYVRYVASLGRTSNWMDVVMIRHRVKGIDEPDEYLYSFYGHIRAVAGLKRGDIIKRGDKVGEITEIIVSDGQQSFKPHLHLELRNTIAADSCDGCYPSDKVGKGYSNKDEFSDQDRERGYFEPSGEPRRRRYYISSIFIPARLPR